MPYFKWKGVTITGDYRSGYLFASSHSTLDEQLFKSAIALTSASKKDHWLYWYRITTDTRVYVFEQIAILLGAGIRLPDALFLVARQSSNPRLQRALFELSLIHI